MTRITIATLKNSIDVLVRQLEESNPRIVSTYMVRAMMHESGHEYVSMVRMNSFIVQVITFTLTEKPYEIHAEIITTPLPYSVNVTHTAIRGVLPIDRTLDDVVESLHYILTNDNNFKTLNLEVPDYAY